MGFLDKLLGRDKGAAEHVRGDELAAEVQAGGQDTGVSADPAPVAATGDAPESQPPS
jgi:hypothetical protein